MKRVGLLLGCLILFANAEAQFYTNKSARIIDFRIEAVNPDISDELLTVPLATELSRVFKLADVSMKEGLSIRWRNENPFNKFKKLSSEDLEKIKDGDAEVIFKVEIEHRYNQVLGGMIKKGKRHVMRLKVAMFSPTGQRVWYHKKKGSCCIDFGVDEEDEAAMSQMDEDSFLKLYSIVLKKTFAKL